MDDPDVHEVGGQRRRAAGSDHLERIGVRGGHRRQRHQRPRRGAACVGAPGGTRRVQDRGVPPRNLRFLHEGRVGTARGLRRRAHRSEPGGSSNGAFPNGFACGGQGHVFTITASALCIGHRASTCCSTTIPSTRATTAPTCRRWGRPSATRAAETPEHPTEEVRLPAGPDLLPRAEHHTEIRPVRRSSRGACARTTRRTRRARRQDRAAWAPAAASAAGIAAARGARRTHRGRHAARC